MNKKFEENRAFKIFKSIFMIFSYLHKKDIAYL